MIGSELTATFRGMTLEGTYNDGEDTKYRETYNPDGTILYHDEDHGDRRQQRQDVRLQGGRTGLEGRGLCEAEGGEEKTAQNGGKADGRVTASTRGVWESVWR